MSMRKTIGAILAAGAAIGMASPASAYLFWYTPNFTGGPVTGTEPGIGLPMPKATAAELKAHMLWNMRAGLNVAALQCQFSPILFTVSNYNDLLKKNSVELNTAYKALGGYFKRTGGPKWQTAFDQYTTRTYNGFSTMHAQLGFCETASKIGRDARKLGTGGLGDLAMARMQEFRNSLVPAGDQINSRRYFASSAFPMPSFADRCWKRGALKSECAVVRYSVASATGSRAN